MIERIGVLMVHGIGTNPPNQFLVQETRKIVAAMSEQAASITVLSEPPVADKVPDKYVVDYTANMVTVEARTYGAAPRHLIFEFNEVYWADLGEKPTFVNQLKFWFWALSMWAVAARDNTRLPGFDSMYIPGSWRARFRPFFRIVLGFYGMLFGLGAATIGLANVIFDRLKLPRFPISSILTAYVGDVMLYTQTSGEDDPAVSDMAQPPRVGIRARMVDAIVEYARRGYDSWYIVAHSQGTVVAYNGLMETEKALPNYLTQDRWNNLSTSSREFLKESPPPVDDIMLPRRPSWLGPEQALNRVVLFGKLKGLLTFGSAIGKFRGIWPITVPANKDEDVFHPDFTWINVYDPTDPVSGPLWAYTRESGQWSNGHEIWKARSQDPESSLVAGKIDHTIAYKAKWIWLLSHLAYLDYYSPGYKRPAPLLVTEVARWLFSGTFNPEELKKARPIVAVRMAMTIGQLAIAFTAVWLGTAGLLWWLGSGNKWFGWLGHIHWPVAAAAMLASAFAIEIVAIAFRLVFKRRDPPKLLSWAMVLAGMSFSLWAPLHFNKCARGLYHQLHDFLVMAAKWLKGHAHGHALIEDVVAATISSLHHPGAARMSVGLLSITLILVISVGWARWLLLPLPVQADKHQKGVRSA